MDLTVLTSYAVWLRVFSTFTVEVLISDLSQWTLSQADRVLDWPEAITHLANQLVQTREDDRKFPWTQLLGLVGECLTVLKSPGLIDSLVNPPDCSTALVTDPIKSEGLDLSLIHI